MSIEISPTAPKDQLDWFRSGTLYQIFPDRFARSETGERADLEPWEAKPNRENFFGGDIQGIASRLSYFKELGVSNIYLNPIFTAPSNHRYDTSNYFQIDPLLGGKSDLENLVVEAKIKSIGVILDGVFNHVGNQFPEFQRALSGDHDARAFFDFVNGTNTYQTCGGADILPKLNHSNPEVLRLVADVMKFWDRTGIMGWRLDVPWKVPKRFWQLLRTALVDTQSSALWIAEAWQQWGFADDFESVTNYFSRTRLLDFVLRHDADAEDLVIDIAQWCNLRRDPSLISNAIGSHDTSRLMTECKGDSESALMILVLNQFLPGVPLLYYGDEIGLEGENDPGCRATMPESLNPPQRLFLERIRPIIRMRQEHLALSHGSFNIIETRNRTLIISREYENCQISLAINAGYASQEISTSLPGQWSALVGSIPDGNLIPSQSLAIKSSITCPCID